MPPFTPKTMTSAHARMNRRPKPNGANGAVMKPSKKAPESERASAEDALPQTIRR